MRGPKSECGKKIAGSDRLPGPRKELALVDEVRLGDGNLPTFTEKVRVCVAGLLSLHYSSSRGHLVPPLGPQDLRPRTDYAAGPRVSAVHRAGSQLTRSTRLPDTWLSDTARSRKPDHQVRKAAGRLVKRCHGPNRRPEAAVQTVSRSNCPSRTPRSRFLFLVFASKAYRRAELPFPLRPVTGHTINIITPPPT
ncbi:hypothetical protein HPB51_010457 [Rhipicephalus microplus]|uniref:Uncharacterized protein n=1 Tax=Rhipicephalus microplus TaxID=6941 RepID=A0A9J6DZX6_RHIMP|nr:hypothetical protein HPB51_010457 [Rhipicephalus microplus]